MRAFLFGTMLVAAAGCPDGTSVVSDLSFTPSEVVRTVVTASWSQADERSRVEVFLDGEPFLRTDWAEPGSSEVQVLGLWAGRDYEGRIETESGGLSDKVAFSTGPLPTDLPTWSTEGDAKNPGYIATSLIGDQSWAVVLDTNGECVWYASIHEQYEVLRARLRRDGNGMVAAESFGNDTEGTPVLHWIDWSGDTARDIPVEEYTHDFVELSDGNVLVIRVDKRVYPKWGMDVEGNNVSVVAPDGSIEVLWSTWDDWKPDDDGRQPGSSATWTHANAMDLDAEEKTITLGLRDLSTIVQLDRATGQLEWVFGSVHSDYDVIPDSDAPHTQHQFEWVGDELLVFDNRTAEEGSRLVQFAFDDQRGSAAATWSWEPDEPLWSYVLGDVHRFDDGSTLGAYSTSGVLFEVAPDGDVQWQLSTAFSVIFGFVQFTDALPGVERVR